MPLVSRRVKLGATPAGSQTVTQTADYPQVAVTVSKVAALLSTYVGQSVVTTVTQCRPVDAPGIADALIQQAFAAAMREKLGTNWAATKWVLSNDESTWIINRAMNLAISDEGMLQRALGSAYGNFFLVVEDASGKRTVVRRPAACAAG